jgi:polysaccharide biosynthesis transport protein
MPLKRSAELRAPMSRGAGPSAGDYLRVWLRVIHRRRYLASALFLMAAGAVAGYSYTRQPLFTAQAQVLIEAAGPNIISFEEVLDEGRGSGNYYQTQYELLRSRALARRTVQALQLWQHPEFGGARPAIRGADSTAGSGKEPKEGSARQVVDAGVESGAIGALLGRLQVVPVRSTRLVNIRFESSDPTLAAAVVNAHAQQYIEQNLEFRAQASRAATDWLTARLDEERRRVEESESRLQRFREDHDAVSLEEGQNIVVQKLTDLNGALTRAKTRRLEAEAKYRQVDALQADTLDSFPAVLGNDLIQRLKADLAGLQREYAQLSETLGERHPRLAEKVTAIQSTEARIHQEIDTIVASQRREFESAVAEESSLATALEAQKREALAQNRRGIEYGVLRREADSTREVYRSLLQRAKETGVSRELRASNIRVVDPAERPRGPSSPNHRADLLLGLLGGLILAVAGVFGRELVDEYIKAPEDLTNHLGLAFLGIVPKVRRSSASVYMNGDVQPAVEAFRALRSLLLYPADGSLPPRSILVTSTNRGEGKTVVATNLAIALATNHRRVLLVDADMRDPRLHELFAEPLEPGLSNVLKGERPLEEALRVTHTPGLELLVGGRITTEATELLDSVAFRRLLEGTRERFHYVIVDSPPVMAVTDAVVAAHMTDAVLFVVGADMTSRESARLAVEQLRQVGARMLGGVLNGADLRRHAYYYAPYYRAGYGPAATPRRRSPLSLT